LPLGDPARIMIRIQRKTAMLPAPGAPLRVGVIGGGPAGSLFALYALHYAEQAGREMLVTFHEGKDFHRRGPIGCNMCAD
jgi:hypothetical protein